jgi:Na+/H+ antiporter NhaD/arsenite permease-like protein
VRPNGIEERSMLPTGIFAFVYLWLVFIRGHRAKAVWVGVAAIAVLPVLAGMEPVVVPGDLFARGPAGGWEAINWNVMGIFAGTLIVAEAFIHSRVPAYCADLLIRRSPNVGCAILAVCMLGGLISSVVENVATVLIVAPLAMALASKLKVSSAPFLIGLAVCSNLEGTATLIGDPPSMLFAAHFNLNFNDFFWLHGRPGIFFAVQVGAVAGVGVLWLLFRRYREPVGRIEVTPPLSWVPSVILALMILGLAGASWVDPDFLWFGAAVCMSAAAGAWLWLCRRDRREAARVLKSYDWSTTLFLAGVFVLVYALDKSGVVDVCARAVAGMTGGNVLGAFVLVVALSVLLSAFIDNVPYLAAMLPLVDSLSRDMGLGGDNLLLPCGLLVGACLGGNVTPIGASANIVAYGMVQKAEGEGAMSFLGFIKIGLPFTLAAVTASAAFLWAIWVWV